MIIVYESKTGFTKKYADMLSAKTGFKAYKVKEVLKNNDRQEKDERIIESIDSIKNGCDGVKEENLDPIVEWIKMVS